ncbi:MAG: hypothetical protein ACE5LU_07950 [Anaerolineae bacterium]
MRMRRPGMVTCATCHGTDGRGGKVAMMMGTFEAPDIRYSTLTEGEHDPFDPLLGHATQRPNGKQIAGDWLDPAKERRSPFGKGRIGCNVGDASRSICCCDITQGYGKYSSLAVQKLADPVTRFARRLRLRR